MKAVQQLWREFRDVPIDDDDCIERSFMHFPRGTYREDIWFWFESSFEIRVVDLMYPVEEEN